MIPVERFKNYLENQKLRLTRERRMVVVEVFSAPGHFTVSELLARLKGRNHPLGRSTIYRVIPLLLQAGMIFEVAVSGGRQEQIYENAMGPHHHDHLICDLCGAVVEFEDQAVPRLIEQVAQKHRYKIRSHVLHLRGLCPDCQDKIISGEVNAWS